MSFWERHHASLSHSKHISTRPKLNQLAFEKTSFAFAELRLVGYWKGPTILERCRMKIGLALMFVRPLPYQPEILAWIAQYAEELGYESLWVPEHIVIPANYGTAYPYNEETKKLPNNDETDTWPNPMVALGYLAALTKKVKLGTCITILPLHHPIEMATQWAALDVLCNGRSILGIGSGWLKEEFEALDVNWHHRGALTDESMQAM